MCLYTMVLKMNAKGIIGDEGTSDLGHPSFLPLPQTMVSKAIEVHYPLYLQYHPSWTAQMGPDILNEAGGTEKKCV